MAAYVINMERAAGPAGGDLFLVAFGDQAQNDEIVRAAKATLDEIVPPEAMIGGELALINGPASLPAACVIAHALGHRYAAIGVFDPKMAAYVVSIAHGSKYTVGDLIPA